MVVCVCVCAQSTREWSTNRNEIRLMTECHILRTQPWAFILRAWTINLFLQLLHCGAMHTVYSRLCSLFTYSLPYFTPSTWFRSSRISLSFFSRIFSLFLVCKWWTLNVLMDVNKHRITNCVDCTFINFIAYVFQCTRTTYRMIWYTVHSTHTYTHLNWCLTSRFRINLSICMPLLLAHRTVADEIFIFHILIELLLCSDGMALFSHFIPRRLPFAINVNAYEYKYVWRPLLHYFYN